MTHYERARAIVELIYDEIRVRDLHMQIPNLGTIDNIVACDLSGGVAALLESELLPEEIFERRELTAAEIAHGVEVGERYKREQDQAALAIALADAWYELDSIDEDETDVSRIQTALKNHSNAQAAYCAMKETHGKD